jgi:hypothetical protein
MAHCRWSRLKSADDLDERALAATARAKDAGEATRTEPVGKLFNRNDAVNAAENLCDLINDDIHWRPRLSSPLNIISATIPLYPMHP